MSRPRAQPVGKTLVQRLPSTANDASVSRTNGSVALASMIAAPFSKPTTFTVTDAVNQKVSDVIAAVAGGSAAATASVVSGKLQIVSNNFLDTLTIGGSAAGAVGFGTGNTTFAPTNLLNQGISLGDILGGLNSTDLSVIESGLTDLLNGVLSLVTLSVSEAPVSLAVVRSGAEGAAGAPSTALTVIVTAATLDRLLSVSLVWYVKVSAPL